ncbi:MAG TPA: hypothetical protein VG796_19235 [Verrucomicrobiales bacterium]|nr:hypothetical protein [Verrucomicrobiales bacterium]
MKQFCGGFSLPISTDVLTKLIERDSSDLDLYADLSVEGPDVEGVTDFYPGKRPRVRIAASLSEHRSENRLRTTLTHEWGHVWFHDSLWQVEIRNPSMHAQIAAQPSPKCKRDRIFSAPDVDWMEWQAGYACGAVLMPLSHIRTAVKIFCDERGLYSPLMEASAPAITLIDIVVKTFAVSRDAARVRLSKLGFLTATDLGPTLF